jgi:diguanylate cyclase (GGDEF)-like protein
VPTEHHASLDPDRLLVDMGIAPESTLHARLVDDARKRSGKALYGRDQLTTLALGLAYVATAIALSFTVHPVALPAPWVLALLLASYALVSRVEFEVWSGTVLATELVLVPMLFLAPPGEVPLLVGLGFVLGGLPEVLRGELHGERAFVRLSYSWHCVGPVLVFLVAKPGAPSWDDLPVYVVALAALFAFDFGSSMLRERLGLGVATRVLVGALGRAYLVDLLLAPVALLAAFAANEHALAFLPVLSLALLFGLIARDRSDHIEEKIVLTDALVAEGTVARADALTGLANRRAWEEHLHALETARWRNPKPVSIVIADLDGLKIANDTLGHSFGDSLIQAAATLIASCAGADSFVARLGGDEIGIAITAPAEVCEELVETVRDAIDAHPGVDGFPLSLSVGHGCTPPEASVADAVVEADRSMYEAKHDSDRRNALPGAPRRRSRRP